MVERELETLARRGGRRTATAVRLYALPTYTALLELRELLSQRGLAKRGPNESAHARRRGDLARRGVRAPTRPTCALWQRACGRAAGARCSTSAAAPGGWRCELAAAGREVTRLDSDAGCSLAALAARARERGLRVRAQVGDARAFELGRAFALAIAPMQVVQLLGGAAGRARLLARASTLTWSRAGCSRPRSPTRSRRIAGGGRDAAAARTCARRTAGCSRARRCPCEPTATARDRAAAPGGLPRRRAHRVSGDVIRLDRVAPAELERRPRRLGYRVLAARRSVAGDRGLRGQHRGLLEAVDAHAARLLALSRPDEHLRRPRQHRDAARPLRVAREWASSCRSSGLGERLDPDSADLFYMGGGQDRDQIAVAQDMAETKREALHAAAGRGAVVLAVCGGYQLLGTRLRARRRSSCRASGSWTCARCASRVRA